MLYICVLLVLLGLTSAFQPTRLIKRTGGVATQLKMGSEAPGPTYWEGTPPSSVLGIGEKIPSGVFGPLSLVALIVGSYCVHESNIFGQLSAETVYPAYVLGSALVPISWGMHVAAWIQKQNGK